MLRIQPAQKKKIAQFNSTSVSKKLIKVPLVQYVQFSMPDYPGGTDFDSSCFSSNTVELTWVQYGWYCDYVNEHVVFIMPLIV